MPKIRVLLASLLMPLCVSAAPVNIVNNGSFEQLVLAPGSYQTLMTMPGWSSNTFGIEIRNSIAGNAQDGANYIELDTTENSDMFQDLADGTDVRGWVNLSFWYSARPNTGFATNGLTFGFGSDMRTLLGEDNYTADHVWQYWSGDFFLSSTDILSFQALGFGEGMGTSVDNVSVTMLDTPVAAVPEPGALALVGAGLFGLGLVTRRSAKKSAQRIAAA